MKLTMLSPATMTLSVQFSLIAAAMADAVIEGRQGAEMGTAAE